MYGARQEHNNKNSNIDDNDNKIAMKAKGRKISRTSNSNKQTEPTHKR